MQPVGRRFLVSIFPAVFLCAVVQTGAAAEPAFQSELVTGNTSGHAVAVDVEIKGADELYLVVTDGGNGIACDWADWAEPRLVGTDNKTKKLTELEWESAQAGWGEVRIDQNAGGGPLRIHGKPVAYGIGTHANSVIKYDLPPGYTRFRARAGLDNGGTNQNNGRSTSVRFLVFTEKPPAALTRGGGNGGGREPQAALAAMESGEGLRTTLFAAEPMLRSPSNIDIDHKGRVWVCEIVNYRPFREGQGGREAGDRILVLEDTDHDGQADTKTVFYQGTDINSPHGICVLADPHSDTIRAIVATATKEPGPHVAIFTDRDGDLQADEKQVLFTGISGGQHDHSIHAFTFGPDGRFYFNMGNAGRQIKDAEGEIVVDRAGNEVRTNGDPYRQGLVFRCNVDLAEASFSNFETLGWNFRNNWMVTIDSFGTMWQSDNDDDGNRGVRINYVMPFGNYGYRDEITGAGWRSPRIGMAEDVPSRHWYQNDPGVVPNLLQTGAGSPTGIIVYEGGLLPEVFQNEMIHCDAGPSVVRSYPVEKAGAGYKAGIVDLLNGAGDKWFRPADVSVAPDGSLIVADWYDPGVGGHRARSLETGRLFRIVPEDHDGEYRVPEFDFATTDGLIRALKNPSYAVRYTAWTALHAMQKNAEPALSELAEHRNPRYRARALWLLGQIEGRSRHYVERAVDDDNPDLRLVGLRLARQLRLDTAPLVAELADDPSPQVRRGCAIALRHSDSPQVAELWAKLAVQHSAGDRWSLEALGIGARTRWDRCFDAWLNAVEGEWDSPAARDVIWRSRATQTPGYLTKIVSDPQTSSDQLPRYLRAFHFQQDPQKTEALRQLALLEPGGDAERWNLIVTYAFNQLKPGDIGNGAKYREALSRVLDHNKGTSKYIDLVSRFQVDERYPDLLALAQQKPAQQIGIEAIRALLARGQRGLIREALYSDDLETAEKTAQVLGNSADGRAVGLLLPIVSNADYSVRLRRAATRAAAGMRNGANKLIAMAESETLDPALKGAAAAALHTAQWNEARQRARELFPLPAAKNKKPLPPIEQLVKRNGDVEQGRQVFNKDGTCADCHKVNGKGKEVGPDLTEIGKKLSRQAMFESILYPNAGISHNYETYSVLLADGNVVNGLLVNETPSSVSIKDKEAIVRTFEKSEIAALKKQNVSLMPNDLQKVMTAEDLVDVVEYLTTLQ